MSLVDKPRVRSCANVRDLGGCDSPYGVTRAHRFVRCGSTSSITTIDLLRFRRWGVSRVLDLRSQMEFPRATCRFLGQRWVTWGNVPFYDVDISAPTMMPAHGEHNYLVTSYLHMLGVPAAVRAVFEFCADAEKKECVLFHCAAGMDRTGMVAMLLLGLVEVPREQILADYCYSFGDKDVVDAAVRAYDVDAPCPAKDPREDFSSYILYSRLEAISAVYDSVVANYGSVREYLEACDVSQRALESVRRHLLEA